VLKEGGDMNRSDSLCIMFFAAVITFTVVLSIEASIDTRKDINMDTKMTSRMDTIKDVEIKVTEADTGTASGIPKGGFQESIITAGDKQAARGQGSAGRACTKSGAEGGAARSESCEASSPSRW